jgi:hypothetical protein
MKRALLRTAAVAVLAFGLKIVAIKTSPQAATDVQPVP